MIVIVNYGLGNLGSIKNMLRKIGVDSEISSEISTIKNATKLILPGVGSFDHGMKNLIDLGLVEVLNQKVLVEKTPILGICLGMQLMTKRSDEGSLAGLGWFDAETLKFQSPKGGKKYSIPHMGWEYVQQKKESKLLQNMYDHPKFYFVHSYFVHCKAIQDQLVNTDYIHNFDSGIENENILGVQFHPEKSHKYGMKLFENFINLY
jgi:imidazole glycerol-phosphate synthase subunit HisH